MSGLLKEERQQRILVALHENRRVTVLELSQQFGTSEVTIRRDLAELAENGLAIRSHRGALAVAPAVSVSPVIQRMAIEREAKECIARAAAELVCEGDSIFIGPGSTMACFARCLPRLKRVTVSTNAIHIAMELAVLDADVTVVVLGGVVRSAELSLSGHITELALSEVRFNKAFLGVQALSVESGWTTDHLPEVTTTRRIIEYAPEVIVLADHTKLGHTAPAWIAPATRITRLVTDERAEPAMIAQLQSKGIQVIVAGRFKGS